jgi:hypothetical protein
MLNTQRRVTLLLAAVAAGGLLAATFLSMAVAYADDDIFVPDPATFEATQVSGNPPWSPDVITATESWSLYDIATGKVYMPDILSGVDTETISGSVINDDFASTPGPTGEPLYIDFTNFGGGWENEAVALNLGSDFGFTDPFSRFSDLLVTPFGDFELFGDYSFINLG